MPVVPQLDAPSVPEEGLPGRPFPRVSDETTPEAFGAGIASGLQALSAEQTQEAAQHKVQNDQLRVIDANTQREAWMTSALYGNIDPQTGQRQGGAFSIHGMDAINMPAKFLPEYDKAVEQISSTLTPDQQRLFARSAAAGKNELGLQLNRYEYEESNRLANETFLNAGKQAVQSAVLGYQDPVVVGKARADIKSLVDLQGDREGWSAAQRDEQKLTLLQGMHAQVIDRMLTDKNPAMAQAYLSQHMTELTGTEAFTLSKTIEAQQKAQQEDVRLDIAGRYSDSLEAAERGLTSPITVKRSEMDVLYPHDAQRRWDELQIMARAGAQGKAYDHMTPEQIADDLRASAPQEGGPEALYQIKAHEILERAAQQSLQKRSDGAQFAQDRGNWNPIDWSKPQDALDEIRQRALTQEEVSNQIGVPVSVLSRREAKQLSTVIDNAKPSDAVAMLTQLRSSIPSDNAYASALSQISNHSPLLSVVGTALQTPQPGRTPVWYQGRFAADPNVAEGIIDGQRILSGKGDEKVSGGFQIPRDDDTSSKTGLLSYFQKAAGGAGGSGGIFQRRPETAEVYYDAFRAYYAHLAADKGVMSGVVDPGIAKQAATAVLGNQTRFNNSTIIVPRGMDPTRFESIASSAIEAAARDAGYEDTMAKALSRSAGLVEDTRATGTGRYVVVDGNGRAVTAVKGGGPAMRIDLASQISPRVGLIQRTVPSNQAEAQ
jgi:hypothetical protein